MIKTVFIGSSTYGLPALEMLCREGMKPCLVISQPDKPAGRNLCPLPTPISVWALQNNLPLVTPQDINSPDCLACIMDEDPVLLITASYGGFIGKKLRHLTPMGAINLHPSLLPKYRGASPIQSALLHGEQHTGNTIYRLIAAMDAGPIIAQETLEILPHENYSHLHERLSLQAAELLKVFLLNTVIGNEHTLPTGVAQEHDKATLCPKIDSSLCMINWNKPACTIINKIRAFSLSPGAWVHFRGAKLKILDAVITDISAESELGCIATIIKNTGFNVNCLDKQILVTKVQAAGKKVMDAAAFVNGARIVSGEKLWM
ncbi:MAG: methionyl-tRNA formyltransferase [Candidatus Cloacimonas sp.]|jgi:methionyl-tRNA formyltransferase|nr:methionyl-tRNA formyltransferase [Candidatus Cloacimonas sp.]